MAAIELTGMAPLLCPLCGAFLDWRGPPSSGRECGDGERAPDWGVCGECERPFVLAGDGGPRAPTAGELAALDDDDRAAIDACLETIRIVRERFSAGGDPSTG